jgi:hypothetical protein
LSVSFVAVFVACGLSILGPRCLRAGFCFMSLIVCFATRDTVEVLAAWHGFIRSELRRVFNLLASGTLVWYSLARHGQFLSNWSCLESAAGYTPVADSSIMRDLHYSVKRCL